MNAHSPLGLFAALAPAPPPRNELRPYQADAIAQVRQAVRDGYRRIVLQMPTGCHAAGAPILMADGRVVPVEGIAVGDDLMGPDSTPRRVTALHRGSDAMFKIVPIKGDAFTVNSGHILSLVETSDGKPHRNRPAGNIVDIAVCDWLNASPNFRHLHKLFRVGVEFPAIPAPSFDPYMLGLLLGDGSLGYGSVSITTPDAEVVEYLFQYAGVHGLSVRTDQLQNNEANTYAFSTARGLPNPMLDALRAIDVQGCRSAEKFVPHEYKVGGRETRLAILAGLIDTDGHHSNGCLDYVSASQRLADDVAFIARSLGLRACVVIKTVDDTPYWRLCISGNTDMIPTRVIRKQAAPRAQKKDVLRTGFTVHAAGRGEYFGFEVDGDRRYLMGDFTVTHNSGKTEVAAAICDGALSKGNRAAFTVPMLSLVNQTVARFQGVGIYDIGVFQGDHALTNRDAAMQIGTVQTLRSRLARGRSFAVPKVMLVDECHVRSEALQQLLRKPEWADVIVVGLSATPWSKGMANDWETLLSPVTMADLIGEGWLTEYRVFAPSKPDLSGVRIARTGDYEPDDLATVMGDGKLVADIVETWRTVGEQRPTLCFAVDRAHAEKIEREFNAAGIRAEFAFADTPAEERDAMGERLRSGQTQVVTNCNVFATGTDWPWVSCLILARPTKSYALHVQQCGRALRPYGESKVALILDHASNTLNLGFPDTIHFDKLDDGECKGQPQPRQVSGEKKPRVCGRCKAVMRSNEFKCSHCGADRQRESKIVCEEGELFETSSKQSGVSHAEHQRFYSELLGYARSKGKKDGWAAHSYRERFGTFPRGVLPHPIDPTPETRGWVQARNIRRAKAKARQGRAA